MGIGFIVFLVLVRPGRRRARRGLRFPVPTRWGSSRPSASDSPVSFLGGVVARIFLGTGGGVVFAVLGATLILYLYRRFVQHRPLDAELGGVRPRARRDRAGTFSRAVRPQSPPRQM